MFEILPQEIIVYNSNYLDFSSLTSFAKTSKQIYALKDVFFKSYYNREFSFFHQFILIVKHILKA